MENLFRDVILTVGILSLTTPGLFFLARAWKLSFLPIAILLPIFLSIGALLHFPGSPFYLVSDGELYLSWGHQLAESWASGSEPPDEPVWPGKGFWPLIVAVLSVVAGPVSLGPIAVNALLLTLAVIVVQKTALVLSGQSVVWSLVIGVSTSPPILLYGPSTLRETIFWLGIALCSLGIANLSSRSFGAGVSALGLGTVVLLAIRPDAGLVLAYGFVALASVIWATKQLRKTLIRVFFLCSFATLLVLSFPNALEFLRPNVSASYIQIAVEDLSKPSVITAFGNSDAGTSEKFGNSDAGTSEKKLEPQAEWWNALCGDSLGLQALCSSLRHLPYALFGPFLSEYGPERVWLLVGLSTVHFLVVLVLAVVFAFGRKGPALQKFGTLVIAGISILLWSTILTNYGVLIRFRAATEFILLPMAVAGAASIGWSSAASARRGRRKREI